MEFAVSFRSKLVECWLVVGEGVSGVVAFVGFHQVDDLADAAAKQCAAMRFGFGGVVASRKKSRQKQMRNYPVASGKWALELGEGVHGVVWQLGWLSVVSGQLSVVSGIHG